MNLTSFSIINKTKASGETILIKPLWRGLSSPRTLALAESYCTNPECTCDIAHIEVEERDPGTGRASAPVRLESALAGGTVAFPENHKANDSEKEILGQAAGGLTKAHLSILRRHYEEAKDWGGERYWKEADWTRLEDGVLVYWTEVFPRVKPLVFGEGNRHYLAEDSYCISPLCDCTEAHIAIYQVPPAPPRRRLLNAIARLFGRAPSYLRLTATLLGDVVYNVKNGKLRIKEIKGGQPGRLRDIADGLFEAAGDLPAELRRRYGFLRDFGRHVAEQKRLKTAPARTPFAAGVTPPAPAAAASNTKSAAWAGRTKKRPLKKPPANSPLFPICHSGRARFQGLRRRRFFPDPGDPVQVVFAASGAVSISSGLLSYRCMEAVIPNGPIMECVFP